MKKLMISIGAMLFILFCPICQVLLAAEGSLPDLSPWQRAGINWRQFEGNNLSVIADKQRSFRKLKPLLPIFEELTGIKVGLLLVEQEEMREKREIDFSSKAGIYDIVPVGTTFLGNASQNNWILPLTPFINDPTLTDKDWYDVDDFAKSIIEQCIIDNKIMSIPYYYAAPVLFYRKDLFEKYKIKVPDTYEEVLAMKKQVQAALEKDGQKGIYGFAGRTRVGAGMNTWTVIPAIRSYGGAVFDDNWNVVLNSSQTIKALEVYRDMITGVGNPPGSKAMHFRDVKKLFREGKLASAIITSHFYKEIDGPEKSEIWDKWGAAPTPRGPVARETSPWVWGWAINSNSQQKKAAWLFIQWVTSQKTSELLIKDAGPTRNSILNSDAIKSVYSPELLKTVNWAMNNASLAKVQTGIPEFPEVGKVISIAFSEIFFGAPVKKTLDEAAAKVEKIMEEGPTRKGVQK